MCTFDIMRVSFYTFGKPAFPGPSAYVAYGLRMSMCIKELMFHTTAVYYPIPTMRSFFNSFFNTPDMLEYVCSTLKSNCSTQWALSNWSAATPLEPCIAKLQSLPVTEGDISYFNRNTMGCRVLHAEFARTDPTVHCPHVSFEPFPDDWGNLICQPQEPRTTPAALGFDDAFIGKLDAFAASRGVNTATGSNIRDMACAADADCPAHFSCEPAAPYAQRHAAWEAAKLAYDVAYPLEAIRFRDVTIFPPSNASSLCAPSG